MNYRRLFRLLDQTLEQLERSDDDAETLAAGVERLVRDFHDDLGIVGGRVYRRVDDQLVLVQRYPAGEGPPDFRIPLSYAPVQELLREGFVLHEPDDPGVDRAIEEALAVRTFAAIAVGEGLRHVVAFSLTDDSDRPHVIHMLNTIRHVLNLKLRKSHLEGRVAEVRAIQLSMLPRSTPTFYDYDVWGRSVAAEEVGGDLYDFIAVSRRSLGIAVADSAGHGLPAALQARDAIVGLRMGVEERLRITSTVEKLNAVVHRSALASRFISLFYGEVEPNGNLVYCNAGHPPPLLCRAGRIEELRRGGMVLGVDPAAQYERGYTRLGRGDVLLAYTDGIAEAESPAGQMLGVERLAAILSARKWDSATALVEEVFTAVEQHTAGAPALDDRTVVAVLRR